VHRNPNVLEVNLKKEEEEKQKMEDELNRLNERRKMVK
jgi:hypothetical protein